MSRHVVQEIINISKEPDWKKLNRFVLGCGEAHTPNEFVSKLLTYAIDVCKFEQAIVFFLNSNKKVIHNQLMNFSNFYRDFYLSSFAYASDNKNFSLVQEHRGSPNAGDLIVINWQDEKETTFIKEYIRPLGLTWSLGFVFYDLYGNYRTIISLDKHEKSGFTEEELNNLYWALPHLQSLHKNYFYKPKEDEHSLGFFTKENSNLTKREAEIANLLCEGMSPANVSKTLYISIATTYKHISNIYEKLGISSQRELLALMLSK